MKDLDFESLDTARKKLGLGETATIEDIKKAYRELVKKCHPDKNKTDNDAHWKTMELMKAYEILIKYCQNYKFSFRKEDVIKSGAIPLSENTDAEFTKWWHKHYGDDPLWGRGENAG